MAPVYCPRFVEDPAARLEVTSVRPRRRLAPGVDAPVITALWARTSSGIIDRSGIVGVLANRAASDPTGRLTVRSVSLTQTLDVTAWCDPRTLAGYVYRDPAG